MTVHDLKVLLEQMPDSAVVTAQINPIGFDGLATTIHFVHVELLKKHPEYGVWGNNWSRSKMENPIPIVVLSN